METRVAELPASRSKVHPRRRPERQATLIFDKPEFDVDVEGVGGDQMTRFAHADANEKLKSPSSPLDGLNIKLKKIESGRRSAWSDFEPPPSKPRRMRVFRVGGASSR